MYLKITFLNGEKHDADFFGNIFGGNALARPFRGETLVATNGEKYLIKDIIVETQEVIGSSGRPTKENVWNYQFEKVQESKIVEID